MAEMTIDMYGAVGRFGNRTYYQRGGDVVAAGIIVSRPVQPGKGCQIQL